MMLIHLREQQNQIFRSFYNYFFVYLFFGKDYEILHQNRFPTFLRSKHLFIFLYMKKARNRVLGASQQIKKQDSQRIEENENIFPFGKMMNEVHKEDVNIWSGGDWQAEGLL